MKGGTKEPIILDIFLFRTLTVLLGTLKRKSFVVLEAAAARVAVFISGGWRFWLMIVG